MFEKSIHRSQKLLFDIATHYHISIPSPPNVYKTCDLHLKQWHKYVQVGGWISNGSPCFQPMKKKKNLPPFTIYTCGINTKTLEYSARPLCSASRSSRAGARILSGHDGNSPDRLIPALSYKGKTSYITWARQG